MLRLFLFYNIFHVFYLVEFYVKFETIEELYGQIRVWTNIFLIFFMFSELLRFDDRSLHVLFSQFLRAFRWKFQFNMFDFYQIADFIGRLTAHIIWIGFYRKSYCQITIMFLIGLLLNDWESFSCFYLNWNLFRVYKNILFWI